MKRNIFKFMLGFVLAAVLLCMPVISSADIAAPLTASAIDFEEQDFKNEGGYTYIVEDEKAVIVSITVDDVNVIVPETLGGYPVTAITDMGFFLCENMETVTIGKDIVTIEEGTFLVCENLKEVIVDENNTAFSSADGILFNKDKTELILCPQNKDITSYTIPSTVKAIKTWAFDTCKLTSVTLNDGLEKIETCAFSDTAIMSVTIPESVTEIGGGAFGFVYGETVKGFKVYGKEGSAAEDYAFAEGFVFNDVATEVVEDGSFIYHILNDRVMLVSCAETDEKDFVVPSEINGKPVIIIGEMGCFYLETIETVTVPDTVKKIGAGAFYLNESLKKVTIGSGVEEIGDEAFLDCPELRQIVIPENVKIIGDYAFGYTLDFETSDYVKADDFTIYGVKGSAAESYATENGFNFIEGTELALGRPEKVTAIQNTSAIKLTWSAVEGAAGYRVYQSVNGSWKKLGTVSATSGTVKKLTAGTKYTFAVRAYSIEDGKTVWSDTYTEINTATQAVKPAKVTYASNNEAIKLTWTACAGADGYRIYYKSGSSWKVGLSTTSKTSHTFSNLKPGSKFTFAVRPYVKTDSGVIWSDYITITAATKELTSLPAPEKVTVKQNTSAIKLTWSEVKFAEGYRIYRKNGSSWKNLGNVTATTATIKNLSAGTKYTFAVRPYAKTSKGTLWGSYKETVTATAPEAVKVTTASGLETIALSWTASKGADGYRIYYKTSENGAWKTAVSATTKTMHVFNNLGGMKTYWFAVRPGIKTASGNVWGGYEEIKVATSGRKYARYEEAIVDRNYYMELEIDDVTLITAEKVGNYLNYTKNSQEGIRYIFNDEKRTWYMASDAYREYTVVPSGYLDIPTFAFDYETLKVGAAVVGGKLYITEAYTYADGTKDIVYFNGNTIARIDTVIDGVTTTSVVKKFTNKFDTDVFSVPSGYKEVPFE